MHRFIHPTLHFAADRIDFMNPFDLFVEKLDAERRRVLIGGKDFNDIAAHPKVPR